MDTALVGAMAGVLGSLVGGSASVATTWIAQKTLNRRELMREEIKKREALYGEFIGECAKLFVDAFAHTLDQPEKLLPVYALINRIRLCASRAVLTEAEHLLARIAEQGDPSAPVQQFPRSCDLRRIETLGELIEGVSERREVLRARFGSLA